ncbi:MAG: hypothetical protein ACKO34_05100 [Vampirovibrionales bacterium]
MNIFMNIGGMMRSVGKALTSQTSKKISCGVLSLIANGDPLPTLSDDARRVIDAMIRANGSAVVRKQTSNPNASKIPELLRQYAGELPRLVPS